MANVPSDALFVLIKSLTKSEKRYFSLQPMSEDGQHRVLFEAIDKLGECNDDKLLKLLKGNPVGDSLSIAKNRLYHALLKALSSFHHKSTPRAEVVRLMQSIEVLFNRSLFEQADKLVNSALKIAKKNEFISLQFELHEWKERITESLAIPTSERYDVLNKNYYDMQDLLLDFKEDKSIAFTKWSWFSGYYTNGLPRNLEDKASNEQLLEQLSTLQPKTLESKIKKLQLQGAVHLNLGNSAGSLSSIHALLELMKANEWKKLEDKSIVRNALANAAVISAKTTSLSSENYLTDLALCFSENENVSLLHSTALTIFLLQKDNDGAYQYVQQHKEALADTKVYELRTSHVWFQCAVICFIQEEYKESEKFIQRFIQFTPTNELLHLQCIAHVFGLALLIELKNDRYIPYALRNVQRFLTTRNKAFDGEKKIFQFLNETLKKRKSILDKDLWSWLEVELLEVKKTDPLFFTYFDFHKWAKAKANKSSFSAMVFE